MIYSIIPIDVIFSSEFNSDYKYLEKKVNGQLIQLNNSENNKYFVSRIISTNPKTFLNPKFQPGNIINF